MTSLDGKLQLSIGSGAIGRADGAFDAGELSIIRKGWRWSATRSTWPTPRIICCGRSILKARQVTTVAGTGEKGADAYVWRSDAKSSPRRYALASPWALWVHGNDLYIAMAGPHQIWKMPLDESAIGPYAGNGREDIVDGPLLPTMPYERGSHRSRSRAG